MNNSIEIYHSQDGSVQLNVKLENETVWLSANQMAMLFDRDAKTIRKHINNVFADGELAKESNTQKMRVANSDKPVPFYNLDVIISVGYRVKSRQGVQFRQWATSVLKQYLIKGYVVNQQIKLDRYNELKDVVRLMSRSIVLQDNVTTDEYSELLKSTSDRYIRLLVHSREPHGREGRDGESCGESNQQRESVEVTIIGLYIHF